MNRILFFAFGLLATADSISAADLPASLQFEAGSSNRVSIVRDGAKLDVNRGTSDAGDADLITHARRDSVNGNPDFAPAASREFLENTGAWWEQWWTKRFDYYDMQVTRRPTLDLPAKRYLNDGDTFAWQDLEFRFIETPGYTRDGGTYLTTLDGVKVAFAGELVREGGRVSDLYSFQEAIPEAKVGGYHGYAGRLAQWLHSLEKLAAEKPDLIVPWRGPVVTDPAADIAAAVEKAKAIYRNYLETNALHWYFGEERMSICAERVLGPDHGVKGMPFCEHVDLPDWCQHIGTTKLLVSESGRGFLLDVGGPAAIKSVDAFMAEGLVKGIDGIFATHAHNDHTAAIGEAARKWNCPVYGTKEVAPVLTRPGAWFLPGLSPNVVDEALLKADGETMRWEEFALTFRSFPGQMLNHSALLVEKPGETPVFFIGDSFSPSGIDDYCLMNRNLMREDTGYLKCFEILETLPEGTWLVNQHIPHRFRFSEEEKSFLLGKYRERIERIRDFVASEDPNFGIDEQWAWMHPYGAEVRRGETVKLSMRIFNHSQKSRVFGVSLFSPFEPAGANHRDVTCGAREEATVEFPVKVSEKAQTGVHVVEAVVVGRESDLETFAEALLKVVD